MATTNIKKARDPIKTALTLALAAVLLACIGATAYIILNPVPPARFTELFLFGPDGRAEGYPAALVIGENKTIIACVENHENAPVWYDIAVTYNNSTAEKLAYAEHFFLEDNESWTHPFAVAPDIPGNRVKIGFQVYKDGDMNAPYRECHLWLNVSLPYNSSRALGKAPAP